MNFYIGRAGSGKTSAVLKEMAEGVHDKAKRRFLIVPELFSHEYERRLAEATSNRAAGYAEVLTFRRIVNRVFSEAGGLAETCLSPAGRLLILHEAVYQAGEGLTVYAGAEKKPELIRALLNVVDELKCYGVTPERLLEVSAEAEGNLRNKLQDIGLITAVYAKLTEDDLSDPRDEMDRLVDRLPESTLFDRAQVYFDGFSGFTPQEMGVIECLLRKKVPMTFALTCDKNEPEIFIGSSKTISRLQSLAQKYGDKSQLRDFGQDHRQKPQDLAILERCALLPDCEPKLSAGESVFLHAASTVFSECEQAAAYIRRIIRKTGAKYRDFVIAARDVSDYIPVLEMVCKRYDVPVFISAKRDLLSKPVLSLVMSALDAVTGSYRYEEVFSYLKTGLANISEEECDKLENYAIVWRIRGTMWHKEWNMNPQGYSGTITDEDSALLKEINQIRSRAAAPLEKLETGIRNAVCARDYVSVLYDFLETIEAGQKITERAERHEEAGRMQLAEEYRQLWEILVSAMEQFAWVCGDSQMSTDTFVQLFRLVLAEYDVGTIPVSMDRVTCGSIDRVCQTGVKHLILLGVNDGLLPKTPDMTGILTDNDRETLIGMNMELSATAAEQMLVEQEVIYKALACPSQSLLLSWHQYGADGSERRPSFLIQTVQKLLTGVPCTSEKELDGTYQWEAERPCFDAACCGAGGSWSRSAHAAYLYYKDDPKLAEACERQATIRGPLRERGLIEGLYGETLRLTASRVDKFYSCKFAFFMQYGLAARKRAAAGFDAPEAGTFLHFVLENTLSELSKREDGVKNAEKEEIRRTARGFVREYIETTLGGLENKSARFRYLFNRLVKMMENILDNVIYELKNSDFVPIDFELDFSDGGDLPSVRIPAGETTDLTVSGKVDRVDGYIKGNKLYFRVMDYKSGMKTFDLSDLWHGLNMQLMIYLFALERTGLARYREKLSRTISELEPVGALYVPARDPVLEAGRDTDDAALQKLREKMLRRSGLVIDDLEILNAMENGLAGDGRFIPVKLNKTGEAAALSSVASLAKLGKLSDHIRRKLSEMGQELLSGQLDVNPYYRNKTISACDYCDFRAACQFDAANGDKKRYLYPVKNSEFWQAVGGDEYGEPVD